MNPMHLRATILAGLVLAINTPAHAQHEPHYAWASFGVGESTVNVSCEGVGCESGWRHHGSMVSLTLGAMVSPHVGVGFVGEGWTRGPSDTIGAATYMVELRYDPIRSVGPFVEGGLGISRAIVELTNVESGHNGLGLMAGVGYEIPAIRLHNGNALMVTPRLSYVYSSIGTLQSGVGQPPYATHWRHQLLSLGVAVGAGFFNAGPKS